VAYYEVSIVVFGRDRCDDIVASSSSDAIEADDNGDVVKSLLLSASTTDETNIRQLPPRNPSPRSRSELCSRRHHTMHSSSEASSRVMMSKRSIKEGGWSSIREMRRMTHLVFTPSFFQGSLLYYVQHEAEMAQKTTEMAIQTPVLMLMKLKQKFGVIFAYQIIT
jgi:hypothetical protein